MTALYIETDVNSADRHHMYNIRTCISYIIADK